MSWTFDPNEANIIPLIERNKEGSKRYSPSFKIFVYNVKNPKAIGRTKNEKRAKKTLAGG